MAGFIGNIVSAVSNFFHPAPQTYQQAQNYYNTGQSAQIGTSGQANQPNPTGFVSSGAGGTTLTYGPGIQQPSSSLPSSGPQQNYTPTGGLSYSGGGGFSGGLSSQISSDAATGSLGTALSSSQLSSAKVQNLSTQLSSSSSSSAFGSVIPTSLTFGGLAGATMGGIAFKSLDSTTPSYQKSSSQDITSSGINWFGTTDTKAYAGGSSYEGTLPYDTSLGKFVIPGVNYKGTERQQAVSEYGFLTGNVLYAGTKAANILVPDKSSGYFYNPKNFFSSPGLTTAQGTGGRGTLVMPTTAGGFESAINTNIQQSREGVIQAVSTAPYLIPGFAPYYAAATGIEAYTFRGGQANIQQSVSNLQQEGFSKNAATIVGYSLPGIQILAGAYGIRELGIARAYAGLEATPLKIRGAIYESEEGGLLNVKGFKEFGGKQYYSELSQPYSYVFKPSETGELINTGKITFEGGVGTAARVSGNEVSISKFISGGRELGGGEVNYVVGEGTIKTPLGEVSSAYGRYNIGELYRANVKTNFKISIPSGDIIKNIQGKLYTSTIKEELIPGVKTLNVPNLKSGTFFGVSSGEEDIIKVVGGEAKNLRYYPDLNKFTITGNLESYGFLKRVSMKELGGGIVSSGGGTPTTLQKFMGSEATVSAYSKTILEKSIQNIASKPADIPVSKILTGTSQITQQKNIPVIRVQSINSLQFLKPTEESKALAPPVNLKSDVVERTFNAPLVNLGMTSEETQAQFQIQPITNIQVQPQISREVQKMVNPTPTSFYPNFPTQPGILPPIIPKGGFGESSRSREFMPTRQRTRYNPGLGAVLLNVRALKIPRSYEVGAGGLTLRPIIVKRLKTLKVRRKR
jgi:hypothetical protein